ncbi:hypothetical protein ACFWR9_39370 [Streptomyces sp. NPDC058534]|uniref:hypothetical protein n=1 Tax=Streptomyces sp. NPDC058534 TaxID=3346541 RepID=UPI00365D497C
MRGFGKATAVLTALLVGSTAVSASAAGESAPLGPPPGTGAWPADVRSRRCRACPDAVPPHIGWCP